MPRGPRAGSMKARPTRASSTYNCARAVQRSHRPATAPHRRFRARSRLARRQRDADVSPQLHLDPQLSGARPRDADASRCAAGRRTVGRSGLELQLGQAHLHTLTVVGFPSDVPGHPRRAQLARLRVPLVDPGDHARQDRCASSCWKGDPSPVVCQAQVGCRSSRRS